MEPAPSHHLGFAEPDLPAAAQQMSAATGASWRPTRDGQLGPWSYRITFSVQGPPYLEHLGIRIELVDINQQGNFTTAREAPGVALPRCRTRAREVGTGRGRVTGDG